MILDVRDETVLILAHPEEVVALAQPLDWPLTIRAEPLHDILFGPETLVEGAVPAGVVGSVDQLLVVEGRERLLDVSLVLGVGRADEGVVRDVEALPEGLELGCEPVAISLGIHRHFLRSLLYLLSVLVEAGAD